MVDLDKFKKLMEVYHKELLKKLDKSELVDKLADKLSLNFSNLTRDDLIELVTKSVQLLGKDKVYEILEVEPTQSQFNEMGSFDEVESFIQASVTDVETLKSGLLLNNEFKQWLIELDELPDMAYVDEALVFSWYRNTSYGILLVIIGDVAELVRIDKGKEVSTDSYQADEGLAHLVVDIINEENYRGLVH